ncbi:MULTISPECIES: ABC transporter ATP-binding protein [unclassified Faecalibacterium]|uniref:ABC transporter ATP-binding protein n=1 Tax=unclassified Faecalibacterium TaxID=2646395 RepID=UPI001FA88E5B|nr:MULTISPECIES: ABC transporter ATP-binding protein [unclassified Faecalibacterium]
MVFDLFCAALTCICDLVLPLILRYITNTAVNDLAALTVGVVLKLGFVYFVLRLIDGLAAYYMADMGHVMGVYIETDMRRDAFAHLQRLSVAYYSNNKIGQIMGRITNDLFDVTEFAHHCPEEFFIAAVKIVASFIILSRYSLGLTALLFLCLPLMAVVSIKLNTRLRATQRAQRVQVGELNAQIEESLLGERVVKAFCAEKTENEKFEAGNGTFQRLKKNSYRVMAAFQTSTRMFDGLMYLVTILGGGIFVVKGWITPGDLVAYSLYVSTLIATIRRIVEFAEQFQRGMTGIERFFEILDTPVDIQDAPGAAPLKPGPGQIRLEHVSFEYPDDHNKVLRNVSIDIPAGQRLALVGPSGGGKTTLCNLIPRFYDVTAGKIFIDDQDIRKVTLESLRGAIGIVQQDVYLFSGTVAENIAYGKPGATREEIAQAARLAGAEKFILALKDGYDTYVGERGVKLSGGQKQRLSIARVFLKNPPILILDEATSALDNESEILVGQSLEKLAHGRTTLTIAHRLTTIKDYDRILVLGSEGILEDGTHEELLAKQGIYYRLWNQLPGDDLLS